MTIFTSSRRKTKIRNKLNRSEMDIDKIIPVKKRHLLLANAVVWGAPGVKARYRYTILPGYLAI